MFKLCFLCILFSFAALHGEYLPIRYQPLEIVVNPHMMIKQDLKLDFYQENFSFAADKAEFQYSKGRFQLEDGLNISSKEEHYFKLELNLGEGYKLKLSKQGVVLDLYDKIFDLN